MTGKERLERLIELVGDGYYIAKEREELQSIIEKDLEELEQWRRGEFAIVMARKSGKTPYYVLASLALDKYRRAFNILKDKLKLKTMEYTLTDGEHEKSEYSIDCKFGNTVYSTDLTKEEHELLGELLEEVKE